MLVKEAIKHLQKDYKEDETIALILWSIDDVRGEAEDKGINIPDDKTCNDILNQIENNHDASLGVNWDTFDFYLRSEDK